MKAHELLADESRFAQRAYALDAAGKNVLATDESAVRWDASGAIQKCYAGNHHGYWQQAEKLAIARFSLPLSHVNDRLGYAAVMEVLRDADV